MHASLALSHQLAPSRGLMVRVGVWVLALHGVALWLWMTGVKPTEVVKRPDISIEFFVPQAVQAVDAAAEPEMAAADQGLAAPDVKPPQAPQPREAPRPRPPAPQAEAAPAAAPKPGDVATLSAARTPDRGRDEQGKTQAAEQPTAPEAPAAAAPQAVIQTATTVDADYKAAYLNNPKPPYPAAAVRRGAEGRVILLAEVLADGRAGRVQLEQSSGHALLDASAMNTVRTWRFTPARKDGVIVTQTVRIPIEFNLREAR